MEPVVVALILVVVMPLGWLASEFQDNRGLRIFVGVLAIAMSFFVSFVVGSLERMRSNTYFGDASKKLIETTIYALDEGRVDEVKLGLKEMATQYKPSYETRANYDQLVDVYFQNLNRKKDNE
jgi:hypothetical protein